MKRWLAVLLLASTAFAAVGPHGINWTWNQSISPGIAANTLKCGTTPGGPYPLVWPFSSPTVAFDWLTTDTTNPPTQGTKYYCVVTATNTFGIESGVSNEAFATFPQVPVAPGGLSPLAH